MALLHYCVCLWVCVFKNDLNGARVYVEKDFVSVTAVISLFE